MNKFICLIIATLCIMSTASASTSSTLAESLLNASSSSQEEVELNRYEESIKNDMAKSKITKAEKKDFWADWKEARSIYRNWKKENPNFKELKRNLKQAKRSIQKHYKSNLNEDMSDAQKEALLVKAVSKSDAKYFGATTYTCAWGEAFASSYDDPDYQLLLLGRNETCGETRIGPGLLYASSGAKVMVCVGAFDVDSKVAGVSAGAAGIILGLNMGVYFGSGLCIEAGITTMSIGAHAGLSIIDLYQWDQN